MGEISKKYKVNGSMHHWTFDIEFPEDADLASKALLMGASMLAVSTYYYLNYHIYHNSCAP